MNQPHKHAEVIKAWADGAVIENRFCDNDNWEVVEKPNWILDQQYRIKPEPEYPKTRMSDEDLLLVWRTSPTIEKGILDVANAAIKQAIIDGDVIINPDKVD